MDPLFRLFEPMPRQGPGSAASTLRALRALPSLPARPRILDLGCGSGASTLVLARETGGRITAVDIHQPFLDTLERNAAAAELSAHIVTRRQSMDALDEEPAGYDLVWSEGAVYLVGFERGLRLWRPLLRPGGFLCVTEATWLVDDPPAEARAFWDAAYPAMGTVAQNLERARAAGYEALESFSLPRSDWESEFYRPLEARMAKLRDDPAFAAVLAETEQEIVLYRRHGRAYGYVFYLLEKTASSGVA